MIKLPFPNPFTRLGQIISNFGEFAVGRMILRDITGQRLIQRVNQVFRGLSSTDSGFLIDLGESLVKAGKFLSTLSPGATLDTDIIPVNPNLFSLPGDQPQARFEVEILVEPLDEVMRVYVDGHVGMTVAEVEQAALAESFDIVRRYPEKFPDVESPVVVGHLIRVTQAERKY